MSELKSGIVSLKEAFNYRFDGLDKKLDTHQKTLEWIKKIFWMVTGAAIAVGALTGLISGLGVARIATWLAKL